MPVCHRMKAQMAVPRLRKDWAAKHLHLFSRSADNTMCIMLSIIAGNTFKCTVNPRKLEHGFRRIGAGFPFSFV